MSRTVHFGVRFKGRKSLWTLLWGVGRRGRFTWVETWDEVTCTRCLRQRTPETPEPVASTSSKAFHPPGCGDAECEKCRKVYD